MPESTRNTPAADLCSETAHRASHSRRSAVSRGSRTVALLLSLSVASVVAESAHAQLVSPGRIGGGPIGAKAIGGRAYGLPGLSGRGQALGDGNVLGGQTFSWSRGAGSGEQLGGGNALDANPLVGSGGSNSSRVGPDFQARNLIVTGNVPGGRGFRGSVGYTADSDFRAPVGSDVNFRFRADSAYSNPVFAATAISRDRFMMAQGLGDFQYRRDTTPTDTSGAGLGSGVRDSRLRLDRVNAEMSLGRRNTDIGEDRIVATMLSDRGDPIRYVASPLRGLQAQNLNDPLISAGIGLYELARARQDIASGIASPEDYSDARSAAGLTLTETQRQGLRLNQKPEGGGPKDLRIDARVGAEKDPTRPASQYDQLVDSLGSRAGDGKSETNGSAELAQIRRELDSLRSAGQKDPRRTGTEKPDPTKPATEGTDPNKPATTDGSPVPPPTLPGGAPMPEGADAERERARDEARGKQRSIAELAEILRHRKTINELSTDDRKRVNQLIREGEDALRAGDFFRAERRFGQAQDLAADNPLIESGIAHAQLGAGLHLSAALTLRNLFVAHPELIDTRYDRALLPSDDRIARAIEFLRQRIILGDDVPSYGLVLAYIGHQTGDAKLVEEGLSVIGGNVSLDTNRELLRGIWLGGN